MGMRPIFRVLTVLAIISVVGASWVVPSPGDRADRRDQTNLEAEVFSLKSELEMTRVNLASTQADLADETASRLALESRLSITTDALAAAQQAQYDQVLAAFSEATMLACGTIEVGETVIDLASQTAACTADDLQAISEDLAALPLVCGVEDQTDKDCVIRYAHTREVQADLVPVTAWAGEGFTDVLVADIVVDPGDTLDVSGYFRVTNELTATVGVGAHLWAIATIGDEVVERRIGPSTGDNVDRARHHMPIALQTIYVVPEDYAPGSSIQIVLRADAHSTKAIGDLALDQNGNLIVRITRS